MAIAQPTAARDEFARDSAIRAVLPLLVLIPCFMLVIGGVVHFSFRPIVELAKRLDSEQISRPHQIPADAAPKELEPFIGSINRLLDRLAVMLDHQRRFVALAAHELRTPVAAIDIQAENLDHSQLPQDTGNRLVALKAGVRRTVRLLEQLLALSKYEYGRGENPLAVKVDGIVRPSSPSLWPPGIGSRRPADASELCTAVLKGAEERLPRCGGDRRGGPAPDHEVCGNEDCRTTRSAGHCIACASRFSGQSTHRHYQSNPHLPVGARQVALCADMHCPHRGVTRPDPGFFPLRVSSAGENELEKSRGPIFHALSCVNAPQGASGAVIWRRPRFFPVIMSGGSGTRLWPLSD